MICHDPDADYFHILREGVPLGISSAISPCPVMIRLLRLTQLLFRSNIVSQPGNPRLTIARWLMSCWKQNYRRGGSS